MLSTVFATPMSDAKWKFERMGFKMLRLEREYVHSALMVRGTFQCICGRLESFQYLEPDDRYLREHLDIDPYEWLERQGSFSREHLRADGYTEEQIDQMYARLKL